MPERFAEDFPAGTPSASCPPSVRRWSRPGLLTSILNVALYQAGWFGSVLAAAAGRPGLAAGAALASVGLHIALVSDRRRELQLVLGAGLLGLVIDTVTVQLGIFRFAAQIGPDGMAPLWIVAIWMQFAMTFHFCFSWLSRRYFLSALVGMVGGPLSFLAGARLGAVEILAPVWMKISLLAFIWAVALPALVALADWLVPRSGKVGVYRIELDGWRRRTLAPADVGG